MSDVLLTSQWYVLVDQDSVLDLLLPVDCSGSEIYVYTNKDKKVGSNLTKKIICTLEHS